MPDRSVSESKPASRAAAVAAVLAILLLPAGTGAQEAAGPSEAPAGPGGGHFAAPDPADLSAEAASAVYADIRDRMIAGYQLSGSGAARSFIRWQRYNTAPYRSATHGERYVNTYANATAERYGIYEGAGVLPAGSTIVKDTFYVSESGGVFPGALMIMEKMEAGFSTETGDWRYSMIMPDGSLFGMTGGENAQSVAFCAACHALAAANDHLFFLPEAFRVDAR